MNKSYTTTASIFAAPANPLFLQAALCALSETQLTRISDSPAFTAWPEVSKALLLEEIRVRADKLRRTPPANPLAA